MDYEQQILSRLIDSYERRSPDQSRTRQIALDVSKQFPAYRELLSSEQTDIEQAIDHLQSWGFVTCPKNLQGYYTKVFLVEAALPKIYVFLDRLPKSDLQNTQRLLLEKTALRTGGITRRFCGAMLERLSQRKEIGYGLAKDPKLLADVLLALEHIERLRKETYIRNFSEMVFHDSKRLEHILNPVSKILLDYGDNGCQRETVLAQYNLIRNPGYVHMKGGWQIHCQGQCLCVDRFRGGIAISSEALEDIAVISVPAGTVISVENLTTYQDTLETQGAILYLGGFLNTVRADLLKKLYIFAPDAQYFHKGDLDPYGFLILENLKEKTGIPFQPLEMDLDTLRRCHRSGHFRPLEEADRRAMSSPKLSAYQPVLQYMLENNCKIEQECFEAMKLEQFVGV